jgi:hypothetical protein
VAVVRRTARALLPVRVRRALRRMVGQPAPPPRPRPTDPPAVSTRLGPNVPGGIRRIHVGSGPHALLADWWNVDIRPFRGVDEVADVTQPWPWPEVDYVFGEHFLEHLDPADAVAFVVEAGRRLSPGGRLRLSTPAIEYAWRTHVATADDDERRVAEATYRMNRWFHGWGHRFVWSRPLLGRLLSESGYAPVTFHAYGESDDPVLAGLEQHGGYDVTADGYPSVWIVEATRGPAAIVRPDGLLEELELEFARHVRAGH